MRSHGLLRWLAIAVLLHEAGFAASRLLRHPGPGAGGHGRPMMFDVSVDTRVPPPPQVKDESEARAPVTAPAPPPPPKALAEEKEPPKPPTLDQTATRFFSAAADAVSGAAKALTSDSSDDAPSIASGDGALGYGLVAGEGTGNGVTRDPRAGLGGKSGGVGKSLDKNAQLGPDRSRPPGVFYGYFGDCDFPAEADSLGIDHASAQVVVEVGADGSAKSVTVVSDPGHGFGRAAKACALKRRYIPARDHDGHNIPATTPPVTVRFTR